MEIKSRIFFVDDKLREDLTNLAQGKNEERELNSNIQQAFKNLIKNAYCGIQIPKKLIPTVYIKKYGVENLWKYDMPKGWRLIYSIGNEGIEVLSVILEWLDHKNYERRFNY